MKLFNRQGRTLLMLTAVMVVGVWAQNIAKVPIKVNVNAAVSAVPDGASGFETVNINVTANVTDTLRLPVRTTNGVIYFGGQRHANAPAIISNRGGNITVNLPAQLYKSAEVSLYTVNGKRIMSRNVSSLNAVNNISSRSVSTGIYLLSVRGADGEAVTARLTHNGGVLNINVALGDANGNISDVRKMAKKATDGEWEITVHTDGYIDSVFTVQVAAGNNPLLNITLHGASSGGDTYEFVTIGGKKWMKKNLNIETDSSWCYDNADANCDKYGRLYAWNAAKKACPSGWHLPIRQEWEDLYTAVGGAGLAGKKLKASSGWNNNGNGTNDYGFSALPGGGRGSDVGFVDAGYYGHWWTATERVDGNAYLQRMGYYDDDVNESYYYKDGGYSVRCVAD